jgi:hypothetical protein
LIAVELLLAIASLPVCATNSGSPESLDGYLHPLAEIDSTSSPDRISAIEAARCAVGFFMDRGISDILICEVRHIEEPAPAWVIDATGSPGSLGQYFDTFRQCIRDGSEWDGELYMAGEFLSFIATGMDSEGHAVWYPAPGPDIAGGARAMGDSRWSYKYLIGRERFESLSSRFPRDQGI